MVVLDLIMPRSVDVSPENTEGSRSSGMLVFRELRRLRSELPILVFTANQDAALIDVIKADPCARYISRWSSPTMQDFVATVCQMLNIKPFMPLPQSFIVHGHDDKTKLEV